MKTNALFTSLLMVIIAICPKVNADDTFFSNFSSYVNIEHLEGLDTDRILIVSKNNVYIGDVDSDGEFNALGARAGTSVWGSRSGDSQVIVMRTPVVENE